MSAPRGHGKARGSSRVAQEAASSDGQRGILSLQPREGRRFLLRGGAKAYAQHQFRATHPLSVHVAGVGKISLQPARRGQIHHSRCAALPAACRHPASRLLVLSALQRVFSCAVARLDCSLACFLFSRQPATRSGVSSSRAATFC